MKLRIAYSPCPNDTFAFHAMIHQLTDSQGLQFQEKLMDIEELNRAAANGEYEVCKMSYHAYFTLADRYQMLSVGSALGRGNGPLLVAPENSPLFLENGEIDWKLLSKKTILIPGELTTAALLLKLLLPTINSNRELSPTLQKSKAVLFSTIEERLLKGEATAGVLIHEGRFTYRERGLRLIADLGELWEKSTGHPIPLGGVAVKRSLGEEVAQKVSRALKASILFAKEQRKPSASYIRSHAVEMKKEVIASHIEMFVNSYTVEMGREGVEAVEALYQKSLQLYPHLNRVDQLIL